MTLTPLFALMLAPNPPLPINDPQMHDIGCVAVIGIIAHEQRAGQDALKDFADVREDGKRWAGLVGERIMDETGQPREVVAFAMKQSVEAEQVRTIKMENGDKAKAYVRSRFNECKAVMDAQLGVAAAGSQLAPTNNSPSMLAPQPKWDTDEPDKIAQYRKTLGEDLTNPHRIRYCKVLIDMSFKEISGREGPDSRDAKAFGRLATAFDGEVKKLPKADPPKPITASELEIEADKEPAAEEKMARCIRLGETLALAMPPEE